MNDYEKQLIEELQGIREHLGDILAVATRCLNNQRSGRREENLLDMQQEECDRQARRWRVYQQMTPEEFDELRLQTLEKIINGRHGKKQA